MVSGWDPSRVDVASIPGRSLAAAGSISGAHLGPESGRLGVDHGPRWHRVGRPFPTDSQSTSCRHADAFRVISRSIRGRCVVASPVGLGPLRGRLSESGSELTPAEEKRRPCAGCPHNRALRNVSASRQREWRAIDAGKNNRTGSCEETTADGHAHTRARHVHTRTPQGASLLPREYCERALRMSAKQHTIGGRNKAGFESLWVALKSPLPFRARARIRTHASACERDAGPLAVAPRITCWCCWKCCCGCWGCWGFCGAWRRGCACAGTSHAREQKFDWRSDSAASEG